MCVYAEILELSVDLSSTFLFTSGRSYSFLLNGLLTLKLN